MSGPKKRIRTEVVPSFRASIPSNAVNVRYIHHHTRKTEGQYQTKTGVKANNPWTYCGLVIEEVVVHQRKKKDDDQPKVNDLIMGTLEPASLARPCATLTLRNCCSNQCDSYD
jgi:hypothetical protein